MPKLTHCQADNLVKQKLVPMYYAVLLGGIRGTPGKRCVIRRYHEEPRGWSERSRQGFAVICRAATWEEALALAQKNGATK